MGYRSLGPLPVPPDRFFMGRPFNARTLQPECTTLCFAILSLKKCAKCLQTKPRGEFSDNKNRPDGKYSYCKDCRAVEYQANSEKLNARSMEHYWANREQYLQRFKDYRSIPENKERIYKQNKAYYACHFFLVRARELKSDVTASDLAKLWKKQRGRCALTGFRLDRENAHLDHILPRAKQGGNELLNLRWVTREVNHAKRDLLDEEFFSICKAVVERNKLL